MIDATRIDRAVEFVKATLAADNSGHDWPHVRRVWKLSLYIGEREGADLEVVQLAALLHDIADWKFHGGDESIGPRTARAWLESQNVATGTVDHVCQIIASLSFKGAGVESRLASLEAQVVQDADRLDAIGAIGVARAFAYGGHAGRAMHDPSVPSAMHSTFEAYKKNDGPTINHFYEKLLLLKDRLNTAAAREIAAERDAFLRAFLAQFLREWDVGDLP